MSASFNSVKHALAFLLRHGQIDNVEGSMVYLKRGAIDPESEDVCDLLDDAFDTVREANYIITFKRPAYELIVDEIEAPGPIPLSATFTIDTESSDWASDGN